MLGGDVNRLVVMCGGLASRLHEPKFRDAYCAFAPGTSCPQEKAPPPPPPPPPIIVGIFCSELEALALAKALLRITDANPWFVAGSTRVALAIRHNNHYGNHDGVSPPRLDKEVENELIRHASDARPLPAPRTRVSEKS